MRKQDIEQRVQASIQPALDFADARLDYYTDGLPREAWEPIAARLAPLTARQMMSGSIVATSVALAELTYSIDDAIHAFAEMLVSDAMSADLTAAH